jgi:heptaprenyl diphosphate synthase
VETLLRETEFAADPRMDDLARTAATRPGKRIRPALVQVAGRFGDAPQERLDQAAAAVELLHVATLCHDDVMDGAHTRRGAASANASAGNAAAVAIGTLLFARANGMLAAIGSEPARMAADAAMHLCAGQLHEAENAFNVEQSTDEHLNVLVRKTGALFELPCALGALLAGLPADPSGALARYGRALGIAFQLRDDALDFVGDAQEMGKATAADLRQGTYGLPVLIALRRSGPEADELADLLRRESLDERAAGDALEIVRRSGTVSVALGIARQYAEHARAALAPLPGGAARESLERLVRHAIMRTT